LIFILLRKVNAFGHTVAVISAQAEIQEEGGVPMSRVFADGLFALGFFAESVALLF
jgi:hypothetical protein